MMMFHVVVVYPSNDSAFWKREKESKKHGGLCHYKGAIDDRGGSRTRVEGWPDPDSGEKWHSAVEHE